MASVRVNLQPATNGDVPGLVSLRTAVNQHLASLFAGKYRPAGLTEEGVRFAMTRSRVLVARHRGQPIATLALSTRKPWAIETAYFSPAPLPLYLTDMAVHPHRQRKGLGRQCLAQAIDFARRWPSTAIRLDAFDAEFGAGEFYRRCGFREVGRAVYRQAALIYFEMLLPAAG